MNFSALFRGSINLLCLLCLSAATLSAVETVQLTASPGASQWVLTNLPVPTAVDPGLILVNSSATSIDKVTIVIGTGVDAGVGKDVLAFPVTPGFTAVPFDELTATLTINATSPATASMWQAALRTVTFSTNSRIARPRTVSFALGSAKPYDGTGHFYEIINVGANITWTAARAAASAVDRKLYGLQGYLATITSSGENSFIIGKLQNNAWIGAVDDRAVINEFLTDADDFADQNAAEGHWYWATGPEAGTEFYRASPAVVTPGPFRDRFNYWSSTEPNDFPVNLTYGDENFAHIRFTSTIKGEWNDYRVNQAVQRYVVEYGGMPGDPAVVLQASRTVSVEWGAPSIAAPSGTQATARPIISGGATFGAGPGKVEVSLDLTANGSYDVIFVTTTLNDGTWSINTASASPTSGTMVDLGPSAISRVRAKLFNASATTSTAINAYPGPASEAVFSTDRLPPPAPIITGPLSPVNTLTPTLYGTGEPGATVTLTIDPDSDTMTANSFVLVTTAGIDGSWAVAVTPGQLINNETAAIVATASDPLGNISSPTNATLAVDTSAPNTPTIMSPGATTNDRTPLISGNAEAGTTVNVVVDPDNNPATNNSVTWVTIAAADGTWFIDTATTPASGTLPVGGFVDETIAIQVTATDAAGNISPTVTTTTLLDATPPAAPQFTGPSSPTNDSTPAITGTGEAGATLTLRIDLDGNPATNDVVTWIVPVASDGTWAIDTSTLSPNAGSMPVPGFPDGRPVILSAVQTDAAGNTGPSASLSLAIDTTPPPAPTVLSPGPVTNNTRPTISGIAEPGSLVTIVFDTDGDPDTDTDRITSTAQADPITGAWSMTPFDAPADKLTDGSLAVLQASATDAAGNTGPITVTNVIIDTTAPVPPTLTAPVPVTNQALPILSGMIGDDTDRLVVVIDLGNGNQVVYTLTRTNGGLPSSGTTWSLNLATAIPDGGSSPIVPIVDGVSPLVTLSATDNALNTTTTSGASFLVDLTAPTAPAITSPGSTSADTTPTISGTAEENSLITVVVGGVTFVTVTNSAGLWQIDTGTATPTSGTVPSAGFPQGTLAISATATDSARNTSTVTVGSTMIDSLPPSQPIITAPGALVADVSPLITGTAEAGSLITVIIDPDNNPSTLNNVTYVVTASTSGAWSVDTGTATPISGTFTDFNIGNHFSVTVQASDAAGNTSSLATTSAVVVGGTGVATITLLDADREFNGNPQMLDVAVTPVGLAMRIHWRPASTPSAIPVELDPANPSHAALWPSAVGTYSIQAIVVEPGWSGTTTATLVIFNQRAFDLEPNRCGTGVPIAAALLLAFFLMLRFRSGLLSIALIALASSFNGQAMAEETPPVAPVSDHTVAPAPLPPQSPTPGSAPTPDSTPTTLPASTDQTPVKPQRIAEYWTVRIGVGPRTEAADERRSDDELTTASWRHSSRVSITNDYLPVWQRQTNHGPLLRLGIEGQSLSGDEAWLTPSNGDRLRYETRALGLNAMGFAGWELHTNNGWQIFAGPRLSLGPVAARIHGELTSGPDKWSDDTWTIGAQFNYGAEGGISWRQNDWGLTAIVGYERQRTSLSYQLENSVDANDRSDTWDRRLDTLGWWWSIGLERLW